MIPRTILTACALALLLGAAAPAEDLTALVGRAAEDLTATRKVTLKTMPPVKVVSQLKLVEEYVIPTLDAEWGGDFAKSLDVFKALGAVPKDLDAKAFLRKYGGCFTAAAYDFLQKRILIPGRVAEPSTLVHELMHASQDERFGIAKLMAPAKGNLDMTLATGALLEGEALNVQLRYQMGYARALAGVTPYGTLRDEARDYFEGVNRNACASVPDAPPAILRAQAFVYEEGVLFVERLRRRAHDWADVDAAYKIPPRSTTQILHPEKYLAGEWPVELTVRNGEKLLRNAHLAGESTLGEFGMRLVLVSRGADAGSAAKALEGWRGDRVFLYRDAAEKSDSVVWVSTWESPDRAAAVEKLLRGAFGGATLSVRGTDVTLLAGDLIPAALHVEIIRKPSAEGRPIRGEEEKPQ